MNIITPSTRGYIRLGKSGELVLTKHLVVAGILVVAFAARLEFVNHTTFDDPIRGDAAQYYMYALNIKFHRAFSGSRFGVGDVPNPDAVRAPLYPFFLSRFVVVPPTLGMLWRIQFVQALIGAFTVVVFFFVFRKTMAEPWASSAALLAAICPHTIVINAHLLSETLFSFLLAAFLLSLIIAYKKQAIWIACVAGFLLGLAVLTRPTLTYFIVFLIATFIFRWKQVGIRSLIAPICVTFALVITPWLVRNYVTVGVISDQTLAINALHHGIYPQFRFKDQQETYGYPYKYDPRRKEIASSKGEVIREIVRRFAEEPNRHLKWYLFGKPSTLFSWSLIQGDSDISVFSTRDSPYATNLVYTCTYQLVKFLHYPLLILSLVGAVLVWRRRLEKGRLRQEGFTGQVLALVLIYFVLIHIIAAPFPRYSIPLRPIIYGLALYACSYMWNVMRSRYLAYRSRTVQP